ncbi:hypothetical protein KK083_20275 [Fulvivirgaceae bacterium PWU4]|uniref:DUF3592 domain-containing protein n=1 Tax=Chryseosolibacter histidini TaxID=2782349 RepID=A0AAP2DMU8_9BACT|nr:hypothetical protein [Chryseosolibacter histidini]MBT1699245.1 hypothetical protein [Chryseosolibacter histidini]
MKAKDRVAVITVLIISLGVFIYCGLDLVKRLSIFFSYEEVEANVIEWTDENGEIYLSYSYFDKYDVKDYTIKREVGRRHVKLLQNLSKVQIRYSKIYPTYTTINGITDYSFIFVLIGVALTTISIYRCIRVLKKKVPISDFV